MLRRTLVLLLALSTFLIGCKHEPVINGSSEAAFKESYGKVCQNLSEEQKDELDKAVDRLIAHHVARMSGKIRNRSEVRAYALMQIDGLTGKEILRKAADIQ